MSENVSKFLVEGCHTEESFKRDTLIELYSSIDAPLSIDSVDLGEVYESTYQILGVTAEYDFSYTVEIGYDRQEQYLVEEKVYDKDLQCTITKNVVKTRTVTDWQPFSGNATKNGCGHMELFNNDDVDLGDKDDITALSFYGYSYDEPMVSLNGSPVADIDRYNAVNFVEPSSYDIDNLVELGAIKPKTDIEFSLPGDHKRNFKASYTAKNISPTVFAVNRYKTSFEFDGGKHFARQFTTELLPSIYCSYTKADDELESLTTACEEEIKNDPICVKNAALNQKASFGLIGGIAVVFLCMIIPVIPPVLAFFGVIGAIVAGVLMSKFNKKYEAQKKIITAKYEALQKDYKKEMQAKKIELLNARFERMGLEPLSEIELERFKLKNSHNLSKNFSEVTEQELKELEADKADMEEEDDE